MGNVSSERFAKRAWLQRARARQGPRALALFALLGSAGLWTNPAQAGGRPLDLDDGYGSSSDLRVDVLVGGVLAGGVLVGGVVAGGVALDGTTTLHWSCAASPCTLEQLAIVRVEGEPSDVRPRRAPALHVRAGVAEAGYARRPLWRPNGLVQVDGSGLVGAANSAPSSLAFAALRAPALAQGMRATAGGCDLGSGRSGLDSLLSSLILLALAAFGMRFRT